MKSIITMLSILTVLFFLSYCTNKKGNTENNDQSTGQTKELSQEELIARGEYLVTIGGCNDCHSPKRMTEKGPEIIKDLMLSGYPGDQPILEPVAEALQKGWGLMSLDGTQAVGPWGTSFAANLTPDATGIGSWTEEQFKIAITKGKFKGMENGRTLLPPMPWYNLTNMEDEDITAIYAYLKSIKPVKNIVPAPIPPMAAK